VLWREFPVRSRDDVPHYIRSGASGLLSSVSTKGTEGEQNPSHARAWAEDRGGLRFANDSAIVCFRLRGTRRAAEPLTVSLIVEGFMSRFGRVVLALPVAALWTACDSQEQSSNQTSGDTTLASGGGGGGAAYDHACRYMQPLPDCDGNPPPPLPTEDFYHLVECPDSTSIHPHFTVESCNGPFPQMCGLNQPRSCNGVYPFPVRVRSVELQCPEGSLFDTYTAPCTMPPWPPFWPPYFPPQQCVPHVLTGCYGQPTSQIEVPAVPMLCDLGNGPNDLPRIAWIECPRIPSGGGGPGFGPGGVAVGVDPLPLPLTKLPGVGPMQ
jgi:hypothetical protein